MKPRRRRLLGKGVSFHRKTSHHELQRTPLGALGRCDSTQELSLYAVRVWP
jgi:hypothetical protein